MQAHSADPAAKERIDLGMSVLRRETQPTFPVEEVWKQHKVGVEVQRHMMCLSASELRIALGVPRLLKSHTANLKTICVASESNPAELETLYMFSNPDKPFRTVVVRSAFDVTSQGLLQDRTHSCYAGQGSHVANAEWSQSEVGVAPILSLRLPVFSEYLRSQGVAAKAREVVQHAGPKRSSSPKGDADDSEAVEKADGEEETANTAEPALEGIAAANVRMDLISPRKDRPAVPPFHRSSAEAARGASPQCAAKSSSGIALRRLGGSDNLSVGDSPDEEGSETNTLDGNDDGSESAFGDEAGNPKPSFLLRRCPSYVILPFSGSPSLIFSSG